MSRSLVHRDQAEILRNGCCDVIAGQSLLLRVGARPLHAR